MIITRKTDNDLYKFTMGNAVYQLYPDAIVEYNFKCRTEGVNLAKYRERIAEEIKHYCSLQLTEGEYDYLKSLGYFSTAYLEFLKQQQPNFEHFTIETRDGELIIRLKGPWIQTILDEVPVLAIISEIYMEAEYGNSGKTVDKALARLEKKTEDEPAIVFADFGTRRRYSYKVHKAIVEALAEKYGRCTGKTCFTGSSNVGFAMDLGIKAIGTMAHEWLQAGQGLTHPKFGQRLMLDSWLKVYKGNLGIALTDVINLEAFLADFDTELARAFDGVRHDSGDPVSFGEKMIDHYKKLHIDPLEKSIIFSDGLNFETARAIAGHFEGRIKCAFGIGTSLTNDVPGSKALQIVMKVVNFNNLPVAKISDSPGKGMCEDPIYIQFLKSLYGL